MVEEIWIPCRSYETYYEVSNLARVRSLDRVVNNPVQLCSYFKKGRILSQSYSHGYLHCAFSVDACINYKLVHRLVGEAFIPNPENKPWINHKDGIRDNNLPYNLEWSTEKENIHHAMLTGLMNNSGANNGSSKITEIEVIEIRRLLTTGLTQREIGERYGISHTHVSAIKIGRYWQETENIDMKKW